MNRLQNIARPVQKTSDSERIDAGPYVGIVKGYGDPTGRNRIAVFIPALQSSRISSEISSNKEEKAENTILCRLMLPYYGRTNRTGGTKESYDGTSKSYGMWFPTPDIDSKVMVIFADGRKENGYIIGGVPEPFSTHMLPGIAASQAFHETEKTKKLGLMPGKHRVPVAEFNRQLIDDQPDWKNIKKPVHEPLFDTLLEQGLIQDNIRGLCTSSSTRESPNNVFGFSTPGPLDPNGPQITQGLVSPGPGYKAYKYPASRSTGHSFVMDDGAATGGSRHVRLRSGTGHQILLHDDGGTIYIVNGSGKSWIEMDQDGNIDIFGAGDLSVHSQGNMNFLADKNINIQSGENINMLVGQNLNIESKENTELTIGGELKTKAGREITMNSSKNIYVNGTIIHLNSASGNNPTPLEIIELPHTEFDQSKGTWVTSKKRYLTVTGRVPIHEPDPRERDNTEKSDPPHLQ